MLAFLQSPAFTIPRAFFYPGCQKVFFCREAAIVRGKGAIEILAIERSLQDVNHGFAAHNHSFALLLLATWKVFVLLTDCQRIVWFQNFGWISLRPPPGNEMKEHQYCFPLWGGYRILEKQVQYMDCQIQRRSPLGGSKGIIPLKIYKNWGPWKWDFWHSKDKSTCWNVSFIL